MSRDGASCVGVRLFSSAFFAFPILALEAALGLEAVKASGGELLRGVMHRSTF